MRVGKKRLSLFGLRPKYTSMIITAVTGIIISGLTLLILTITSSDVRTALFEMREIKTELYLKAESLKELSIEAKLLEEKQKETDRLLKTVENEYRATEEKLSQKQKELEKTQKNLLFEQERLSNMVQVTKDLNEKIVGQEVEKEKLAKEIQALSTESSLLKENLKVTKTGRLIFMNGDILVARVVQGGLSESQLKKEVIEPMLLEANKIALERGARLEGKEDYALKISTYQVDYFIKELAKLKQPAVVRLLAEGNTVVLEPLHVTFQFFPNELVFKKGEVIARAQIPTQMEENEIMDEILNLLLVVRKKALDKGMVSEGQYIGEIASFQEIPPIIQKIKSRSTKTTVQVVAENDVWRIKGPVKVVIEIDEADK